MEINKIQGIIEDMVNDIRKDSVFEKDAIKDGIFGILEKSCTVIYYPFDNEKNRGFHIKKIVKNTLENFVYINTAKPMAEQIFTAAHEYGHIYEIAAKVWRKGKYDGSPSAFEEENITNLFAAELLMPTEIFQKAFRAHLEDLGIKGTTVKFDDFIRVIVLLMGDFMTPYESVRKRLVETNIISSESADYLLSKDNDAQKLVAVFTKDINTYIEKGTQVKTISGIRSLIEASESKKQVDICSLNNIKNDFEIMTMPISDDKNDILIGAGADE